MSLSKIEVLGAPLAVGEGVFERGIELAFDNVGEGVDFESECVGDFVGVVEADFESFVGEDGVAFVLLELIPEKKGCKLQ